MGSLGKKMFIAQAIDEFNKLKELLIPVHCKFDIDNITVSGSIRRGKESNIGDVDIILTTVNGTIHPDLHRYFEHYGYEIDASGDKLIRMIAPSGVQFDLYSVSDSSFYCMMAYLTGPSEYNIGMRAIARRKGYKLNQDNLIKLGTGEQIEIDSEEKLFNLLGCSYIEPRDRISFYDSLKHHKA